MKQKKKITKNFPNFIVCDKCGYNNFDYNVERYGTCLRCGKVLDEKAKFNYEMVCRLKTWRYKKNKNKKDRSGR